MKEPMVYLREDTIAALSTPQGRGAIAIIRMSGPQSLDICNQLFQPSGKINVDHARMLCHGVIVDPENGKIIDDVLCAAFPAPNSYTGENLVEIHCHGSEAVVHKILDVLYHGNARPAEAGEFTFRAVRNGKMDLTQAEGLSALIESRSQLARALSLRMLEGEFTRILAALKEAIISALVELETQIEFPDEAAEETLGRHLREQLANLIRQINEIRKRAVREQRFEQGIIVVLAGRPNVGKSSLFNRLLGRERAIVTPHPGTTRDSLEGTIELNGRPVTLIDTAGLRETCEEIEAIGVKRSKELLTTSHIILFICDVSTGPVDEDRSLLSELSQHASESRVVLIANKRDLCSDPRQFDTLRLDMPKWPLVTASAAEEHGLEELLEVLSHEVTELVPADTDSSFMTTARQERLLSLIEEKLEQAYCSALENVLMELIAEDLRSALRSVSELDGSESATDIMNTIFSRFCIGK
ncbi:MAG: tRNA uridine-5-carboxymethylaminomethyl(34) synthesis GTPase MnmE [Candidatus Omnitrophota bacterium]|jgi:tRNA modification GTPase|nr:MAG: tRNA uridine-5-carboxymethylaminomethyl(34) synthesis GTPase MnmE [Candidatus Omnitrophota bacterium]